MMDVEKIRNALRRLLPLCSIVLLLTAWPWLSPASASEESERLYNRGLVEFHALRYPEALALFDQAVAEDPADAKALYYRGVTRERVGNLDGAIVDLRQVRGMQPGLAQAALDLGIALVDSGKPDDALEPLQEAQRTPRLEGDASLYLGLAHLRLRNASEAQQNLARAAKADTSLEVPARYYEGVAAYQAARWDEAQQHFEFVAAAQPTSPLGREASVMLDRLRVGAPGVVARPFELYGRVAGHYDSNVGLGPSSDDLDKQLGLEGQGDYLTTFLFGMRATPLRLTRGDWHAQLSLGYEFFQSIHADLTAFDLQNHRPYIETILQHGPIQIGFLGRYDYYLVRSLDSFLSQGTVIPWVGILEGSVGRTDFSYRARFRDFEKRPFDELNTGTNQATGVRQTIFIDGPGRDVWLGYRYEYEDPYHQAGDLFGYNGHEVSVGVDWRLPWAVTTEASYTYEHQEYFKQSGGRNDEEHQVVFAARKAISEHLNLIAGYFGTFNDSNQSLFKYQRHIGSLGFEVRY